MLGSNVSIRSKLITTGIIIAALLGAFNELCRYDYGVLADAATISTHSARLTADINGIQQAWSNEDHAAAEYHLAMLDNRSENEHFAETQWGTVNSERATIDSRLNAAQDDTSTPDERNTLDQLRHDLQNYQQALTTNYEMQEHGRKQDAAHAQGIALDNTAQHIDRSFDDLRRLASLQLAREYAQTTGLADTGRSWLLAMEIIGTIYIGVVLFILGRNILIPLQRLGSAAQCISNGDLEVEHLLPPPTGDELGELAAAFRMMVTHQAKMATAAEAIASGDLGVTIMPKTSRDRLGQAFHSMVDGLREFVGSVSGGANRVDFSAGQIASSNNELKLATEQIAKAISDIAAGTTNQMKCATDAVSRIKELRTQVSEVATGARGQEHAIGQVEVALSMLTTALKQTTQHVEHVEAAAERAAVSAQNGRNAVGSTIDSISGVREVVIRSTGLVEKLGRAIA